MREVQEETEKLGPEAYDAPDRVAAAILSVAGAANPPARLVTGSTALKLIRDALQDQLDEFEAWRDAAEAVDRATASA